MNRWLRYVPLVLTTLLVFGLLRLARTDLRYLFPLALVVFAVLAPPWLLRRRTRRLLQSGDVRRVLGAWQITFERVAHPETMAPLLAATAYAAYGWLEAAHTALARSAKGPVWDAAIEQRLFVETLLDSFEGERERAVAKAEALCALPYPSSAGFFVRRRVTLLRQGLSALARAFARKATPKDLSTLRRAGLSSPLVHWPMRYAQAIVAVDAGDRDHARALLEGAPQWPEESAFKAFDSELRERVEAAGA